jgi:hypothetical protein
MIATARLDAHGFGSEDAIFALSALRHIGVLTQGVALGYYISRLWRCFDQLETHFQVGCTPHTESKTSVSVA